MVGLRHLGLDFPLVEQDVIDFLVNCFIRLHVLVCFAHSMGHGCVHRCHLDGVDLACEHFASGLEILRFSDIYFDVRPQLFELAHHLLRLCLLPLHN